MTTLRSRFLPLVCCATLATAAVACGDRTAGDAGASAGATPGTGGRDTSVLAGDPVIAPPELLAHACIAGDPIQGVPWTLDSVPDAPLALALLDSLAPRDSAQLAARLARTVDVLPSDTSVADFRGLPVTVRAAWRMIPADGDTVIVALVVRRMPMESNPLEELFTLVASPASQAGTRAPLIERWFVRDVGLEEALVSRELVGAYLRGTHLVLAFVEDAEGGLRVALVERGDGRWGAAWSGRLPTCAP